MKHPRLNPIPNVGELYVPLDSFKVVLQAAGGLSDDALMDCLRVLLDRYDAVALEQLGNEIGRIAHEKSREEKI